jgi:hypothetical protein
MNTCRSSSSLGGDYQPILPMVPQDDCPAIVAGSPQFVNICPDFELLTLHENKRLAAAYDDLDLEFIAWHSVMSHSSFLIGPFAFCI